MTRVLVMGAGGMAGHVISTYFLEKPGYDVVTISANNRVNDRTILLDITDKTSLNHFLDSNNFDVVINCIGMLVKASEERKDLAAYINSYLPHLLEERYKDTTTKIIHLSTDCVFSGKNAPYTEDSWPDGELFYDRSKALGEINNTKDLTFRMSIIGPDSQPRGIGLFNWFYAQTGELKGYRTAIWNGVTTITLAHAIDEAIQQNLVGLYHLVPAESISKHGLLELFKTTFQRDDITIAPVNTVSLDKTLVNTRTDFAFTVPSYPAMVNEMKEWITSHPELYTHYERGQ
jgi:dTDP-4-dehydrorhamnose reductase